jgi:translocator protein
MTLLQLLASVAVCQLAGVVGSLFTMSSMDSWYAGLEKPVFNPPSWVFGPVWITLYTVMGISLFLFWRAPRTGARQTVLAVFLAHLVVNALWSAVFFGAQQIGLALLVIVMLWTLILYLALAGRRVHHLGAMLLWPYLAWVSFAAVLNASILLLN